MSLENASFPSDHLGYGADARKGLISLYGKACQSPEAFVVLKKLLEFVCGKVDEVEASLEAYIKRYTPSDVSAEDQAALNKELESAIALEIKTNAEAKQAADKAKADAAKADKADVQKANEAAFAESKAVKSGEYQASNMEAPAKVEAKAAPVMQRLVPKAK